jgi:hypothetical protein
MLLCLCLGLFVCECRMVIQSLPLILVGGVVLVLVGCRVLQWVQVHVFRVIPFGKLTNFDVTDACIGILVSGQFMLYFGTWGSGMRGGH